MRAATKRAGFRLAMLAVATIALALTPGVGYSGSDAKLYSSFASRKDSLGPISVVVDAEVLEHARSEHPAARPRSTSGRSRRIPR
jgi:hypothetical protein